MHEIKFEVIYYEKNWTLFLPIGIKPVNFSWSTLKKLLKLFWFLSIKK